MDIIREYLTLYGTGFAIGVSLAMFPVIMGSAIGLVYKVASTGRG